MFKPDIDSFNSFCTTLSSISLFSIRSKHFSNDLQTDLKTSSRSWSEKPLSSGTVFGINFCINYGFKL